jgi:phage regulator Rha-like protein
MLVMGMKGKEFSEFKMKMLNDFNSLESSLGLKLDLTGRK